MTYKVLKSLVYGGIAYAEGQKVDIIEKSVAENCLERELIAEITENNEANEANEDATGEVVSSETVEETTENIEETTEEQKKNNKRNRK